MPSGLSGRCTGAVNESPLVIQKPFSDIDPALIDIQKINAQIIAYKQKLKEEYLEKLAI